jgi:hypothetical protein
MYDPDGAVDAGFLDVTASPDEVEEVARAEAERLAAMPRTAYAGQVLANRGERLGRLADAIAEDQQLVADLRA